MTASRRPSSRCSCTWPRPGASRFPATSSWTAPSHQTDDRAHVMAVCAAHNQAVREEIGPDRLLVFDVKEGWEPLCAFLGVPVPDGEAFPHLNDTAEFKADERKR